VGEAKKSTLEQTELFLLLREKDTLFVFLCLMEPPAQSIANGSCHRSFELLPQMRSKFFHKFF
jgi:hypothetical protein